MGIEGTPGSLDPRYATDAHAVRILPLLFRGLLARSRTTLSLALSGALRIMSAGAAASVSYAYPELNGALMGIGAWILSYAIETAISSWRLTRLGWYVETG